MSAISITYTAPEDDNDPTTVTVSDDDERSVTFTLEPGSPGENLVAQAVLALTFAALEHGTVVEVK